MKYSDGQEAKLGDIVDLGGNMMAEVVLVVDSGDHASGYDLTNWTSLDDGVLMTSDQAGLIHYPDAHDHRLELIRRADPVAR